MNRFHPPPPPPPHPSFQPLLDQYRPFLFFHPWTLISWYKIPEVSSVECDLKGARRGRKASAKAAPNLGESGGLLPEKIFKFRVLEMPSPAISAGHFQ